MQTLPKLILIGGGGHCKVVIDAVRSSNRLEIFGIVDSDKKIGDDVEGVRVIGRDQDLQKFFRDGIRAAFVAIGSLGSAKLRKKLSLSLEEIGFESPSVIHGTAYLAPSVRLGSGVLVAAGSLLQPGTVVGDHAIINTRVSIDHDCEIGRFVHIAPGAVLSGGVVVGDESHIGTGSSVIEYRKIGTESLVGAGSVVVTDIPDNCKAFGNPCRPQK